MIAAVQIYTPSGEQAQRLRKLTDAAQQFEAMFLQQMLSATGVDGEKAWAGDENASAGNDSWKAFGVEAVARALSAQGGLGIARQIVKQVSRQVEHHSSPAEKDETGLKSLHLAPIGVVRRPE